MNIFELLVVQPIFNLLIGLYALIPGGDFGISLIIFTIFVRFALYPLTKKMLHQTKAIRKLQPELAKIKAKSKGNKQQQSMQMLDLYKKHNINPFRSIGILLIQLPIFIALFQVITIFTSQRDSIGRFTYDFLEGIAPIKAIIDNPASFNENLFGVVDLTQSAFGGGTINFALILLAVIAAVTQFIMSKQTMPQSDSQKGLRALMAEAAQGKEPDQAEMNAVVMNKMIKVLPYFMFVIMITVPGALALYYATSNIVAVIQQHFVLKQDEHELEEVADEKPVATGKKATAKARAKQATEATTVQKKNTKKPAKKSTEKPASSDTKITRITAKDTPLKSTKKEK